MWLCDYQELIFWLFYYHPILFKYTRELSILSQFYVHLYQVISWHKPWLTKSHFGVCTLLRSAVGMTHSLRLDLWWAIPFRFYLVNFGIPLGSHTIKPALARHTGVQVSLVPAKVITWSFLTNHKARFGYCFSGPLPLRSLILGPLSRVHFGESLVVRLYTEIDHTYLSIEAQCVSHHYPRWTATRCLSLALGSQLTQIIAPLWHPTDWLLSDITESCFQEW